MSALRTNPEFPDNLQQRSMETVLGTPAGVQAMPATHPSQMFFHFDFRRSLQMHKGLAAGIFGFVLLLAVAYAAKTWNNYFGESIVYVQPAPPKLMETGPSNRWPYDANTYESYMEQQIHNVARADVLLAAAKKIPDWQFSGETPQAAAERLGRKLTVARIGVGYQISIRAKAKDAARAAQMANAVAASFIASSTQEQRAGDTQRIEILREERDRIQKELVQDRTEQEDLNKKLGIAAVSGAIPDPIDEQISAVRTELVKARTENDQAAARLTAETRGRNSSSGLDAQAEEIASTDPGLSSMKTTMFKRRSELITQMANLTPNHPVYKQDAQELAQINTSLDKMSAEVHSKAAGNIEQKLKSDLDRTSSVEAKLNGQLSQLIASAGTATPRLQRFNDLTTDIQRLQARFATVDEQYRNLNLENNAPGAVYLSSAAMPPLAADRGIVIRNVFILIVMGLVLGMGSALIAQNADKRIYIATDVERILGFAPMAQLPDFYEVGTGVSEEYMLRLAAGVEHAHQQGALKSCIFTAAGPGAGATTVVKRVTGMLEAMGRTTVLVDASGTPPAVETASEDAPGNQLVTTRGGRSTALLQQMSEEMDENTVVLTDTAPLLVSGETEYLARFVDSAIVVIESGATTRDELRRVAETLHRLEVRAVGFVLNRISLETADAAFRQSVKAVELHVASQTRMFVRETESGAASNSGRDSERDSDRDWSAQPAAPVAPVDSVSAEPARAVAAAQSDVASEPSTPMSVAAEPAVTVLAAAEPAVTVSPAAEPAAPFVERASEPAAQFVEPVPEPTQAAPAPPEASSTDSFLHENVWGTPLPRGSRVDQAALDQARLDQARLDQARLDQARLDQARLDQARLGQARLDQARLDQARLDQTRLDQESLDHAASAEAGSRSPAQFVAQPVAPATPIPVAVDPIPAAEPVRPLRQTPVTPLQTTAPQPHSASVPDWFSTVTVQPELKPAAPRKVPVRTEAPVRAEARVRAEPPTLADSTPADVPSRPQQPLVVEPSIAARMAAAAPPQPPPAPASVHAPRAAQPDTQPADDDLPYSAASRLGGLRNLLATLGMRAAHPDAENGPSPYERAPERPVERPVYAEPYRPASSPVNQARTESVIAQPEFLPPRAAAEPVETEKATAQPEKEPRLSHRENYDDVETLPSWRGQYRKRR